VQRQYSSQISKVVLVRYRIVVLASYLMSNIYCSIIAVSTAGKIKQMMSVFGCTVIVEIYKQGIVMIKWSRYTSIENKSFTNSVGS
jgi:hypothetical protein